MSEIPYYFETPVPKYFRESGWFENEKTFKFVTWAFSKCSSHHHKVILDRKEVTLEPFEFVAGRLSSPAECFLTEKEFRGQLKTMIEAKLLKKGANSKANRFTTYIWLTDRFSKNEGQQKGKQRANKGPTQGHNQEDKNIRIKEDLHPYPSSFNGSQQPAIDRLTDDFSSSKGRDKKTEIYPGVFLSQEELDACISLKGSIEEVNRCVKAIQESKTRRFPIRNWPNTLSTWDVKHDPLANFRRNQQMANGLIKRYPEFTAQTPYRCVLYRDRQKDQEGILFEAQSPYVNSEFVAFSDGEFEKKVNRYLRDHRMQLSRVK